MTNEVTDQYAWGRFKIVLILVNWYLRAHRSYQNEVSRLWTPHDCPEQRKRPEQRYRPEQTKRPAMDALLGSNGVVF